MLLAPFAHSLWQRLYHIHKKRSTTMLIIDAHEDIAYNALEWQRDIRLSAHTIREREQRPARETTDYGAGGIAMSGLPELRRGGFGVVFGVIFCMPVFD